MLEGGYIDILKINKPNLINSLLDKCPDLKKYNLELIQSNEDYLKHTVELIKSEIKYEDFLQILYLINPLHYMSKIYQENYKIYSNNGYLISENILNEIEPIKYIFNKTNFTINSYNNEELHIEPIKNLTDIYNEIILNNKTYVMSQGIFYKNNMNIICEILIKTSDYYLDNLSNQFIKFLLNMLFVIDGITYIDLKYNNIINQLMFIHELKSVLDFNININIDIHYKYDDRIANFFQLITDINTDNKIELLN